MKLDDVGYNLIKSFEGLSLVPYKCQAGISTIGYGNTFYPSSKKVTMQDAPISLATAKWMLKETADKFAADVDKMIKANLNQNQFNAIVSLAYNIGLGGLAKSSLLKKVNANPSDPTIRNSFLIWNKAGGRVLDGLTKRRTKEANLYFA
jgi:lysozyme